MSNHCKCRSTVSDSISADLIREVRARPALWNCKDENYKSSVVTRKLWNDIGNIINKTDVEARKKWKSLRDMYRRNMHPLATGQSKKIWKFTESMHFLRDSMSLLPNDVFHDFNENDETNNIVFEEDANESQPGSETSMGMDVTLSVLSDPLRSEPLHSDPLSSEPLRHSDQLRSDPLSSEPLHSNPLRNEPLHSDPLSSEPLHSEPSRSESLPGDPLSSEPLRSESLPSDPLRIEQLLNEPSPSVPSSRIRPRRSKSSLTPRNTEYDMLELEKAKIEAILNLGRRKVEEGNDDYHFLMSLLPYIKDLHPFVKSELREQVQGIVMKCYRENMQDEQQIGNNNLNVSKGCSSNAKAGKSTHSIIHDTFDDNLRKTQIADDLELSSSTSSKEEEYDDELITSNQEVETASDSSSRPIANCSAGAHGGKDNQETLCLEVLTGKVDTDNNEKIHTGEKRLDCEVSSKCSSQKRDSIENASTGTNNNELRYQCEVCSKCFLNNTNLQLHLRIHTDEKPYQCEFCSKLFRQSNHLIQHIRTHTGETPFQCSVCSKAFKQKTELNIHFLTHTGERPHQCKICYKTFTRKSRLNIHLRIHTGERPYRCNFCTKAFVTNSCLTNHLRTHSGERPFQCQVCSKRFKRRIHLKTHKKVHA